jgi:hypothetical protein
MRIRMPIRDKTIARNKEIKLQQHGNLIMHLTLLRGFFFFSDGG